MTAKVVKGSIWTLMGSVIPLTVSFLATPFVIRFLGSEAYGVLLLVGLIPTYFAFGDFGMALASTKFASEAYGRGDPDEERRVVWTAAVVATLSSLVIALPILLLSQSIVVGLNVPEQLTGVATTALRICVIAFVIGVVGMVLNSPMLARLRMDLNTVSQAVPKIMLAVATPIVLYLGGGIVGAVSTSLVVTVLSVAAVLFFSARLLPELLKPTFDGGLVRPLVKFGGAMLIAMIAAMLLVNLEKLFLTKMVSVQALAYYSVAFTFANMATLFSSAMSQSLLPAFARLQTTESQGQFGALFGRAIRLNLLWLIPALLTMLAAAKPFFTLWAGEEFGRESTLPFCILLIGLFFNVLAYVPHATITAAGHTHIFAKLYWMELVIYAVVAYMLIARFGILGAAAAWSLRSGLDALVIIFISKRAANVEFAFFGSALHLGLFAVVILPAMFAVTIYTNFSAMLIPVALGVMVVYAIAAWRLGVDATEREWIISRVWRWLRR